MNHQTDWMNHPALAGMHPRKKELLTIFIQQSNQKPITQLFPMILATSQELKRQNLSFSDDEKQLIFEILTQNLSEQEKAKASQIRRFMK